MASALTSGAARRGSSYRWAILAVGTGAQAAYSAVLFGVAVFAPALRSEYGLTLAEIGIALASFSVGSVVTLVPWGVLADRTGERRVLAAALGGAALALAAAAAVRTFPLLVAALVVAGALGAGVNSASGRAVMAWFPPAQRGLALGLRQTAIPLGGALAAAVLPTVLAAGGLAAGFLGLAAACGLSALAGAALLRDAPDIGPAPGPVAAHPLRDRRIWRLSWGSALLVAAQTALLGFAVLFLHDERALSTGSAAMVLVAINVLGALLRVASGRWSDRLRTRIVPFRQLTLALAAAVALLAVLTRAPLPVLVLALTVAGALSMSWNGLSFTAAAELAGRARSGVAIGFQQTALAAAGAAAPPVFAAVVAATSWQVGFGLLALFPLAAYVVLGRLREPAFT